MKRKQLSAILLSAILSFSGCVPMTVPGVYAAENDSPPVVSTLQEQEAVGQGGGSSQTPSDQSPESFSKEAPAVIVSEDSGESVSEAAALDGASAADDVSANEVSAEEVTADETAATDETAADVSGTDGAPAADEVSADEVSEQDVSVDETAADDSGSGDSLTADETAANGSGSGNSLTEDEPAEVETPADAGGAQDDSATVSEDGSKENVKSAPAYYVDDPSDEDFANATEISVGDVLDVSVTRDSPAFFRFTPAKDDSYVFYSTGSGCDPGLILYSGESHTEKGRADDENDSNFRYSDIFYANTEYYIQAYCYDEQAEYQLHLEKMYFYAEAADEITDFYLEKGSSQTLQVNAGAAEGEKISYLWQDSAGNDLVNNNSNPASYTVENIQSYNEISCLVRDESGNSKSVCFYLYVNDVISAWPSGGAPGQNSINTWMEEGSTAYLSVNIMTGVQEYSVVWYDEEDQVLQDDGNTAYDLSDVQKNRTIRCHVADSSNPDNCADVFFHIRMQIEYYVYPEGNDPLDIPETTINIEGKDSVTLHTIVDTTGSTEGITYKWETQKYYTDEWVEISDCHGDTYEISMPKKAVYRCTATDADENTGAALFYLNTDTDTAFEIAGYDTYGDEVCGPEIVIDADQTDGAFELKVTVLGEVLDRLSYQWYKDTGNGEEIIDGASACTYTTDHPVNGEKYTCIADNGYGDDPRTFSYVFRHYNALTAYTDDTRFSYYDELDPRDAESFTLTPYVSAEDTEGLTYKWELWDPETGDYAPTGDTSPSLTVYSPANENEYRFTVTDPYGNSRSVIYFFEVNNHMRIYAAEDPAKRSAFYIDITGKETLTLNAVVEADKRASMTYLWRRTDENGDTYNIDGKSGTVTGGGTLTLQPDPFTTDKEYICLVMDDYGYVVSLSFKLVTETPSWSIRPEGASEGEDTAQVNLSYDNLWADLQVICSGSCDDLSYVWKDENGNIVGEGFPEWYGSISADSEKYSCTAIDSYGRTATVWFEMLIEKNPDAPTEEEMAAAQAIKTGQSTTVELESDSPGALFAFTPEEDGTYIIYSSLEKENDAYPTAELYNQRGLAVADSFDIRDSKDFLLRAELTAGKTYYLKTREPDGEPASYTLYVEKADFYAFPNLSTNLSCPRDECLELSVCTWSETTLSYQWYEGDAEGTEDSFAEVSGAKYDIYSPLIQKDCSYKCHISDQKGNSADIIYYITAETNRNPKDSDFETASEIHPGDTKDITLTEDHFAVMYKLTADKNGRYCFQTDSSDINPMIEIFTPETVTDETGTHTYYYSVYDGFAPKYSMNAGDTVYLRVYDWDYRAGSCTLQSQYLSFWAEASTDNNPTVRLGDEVTFGVAAESVDSELHYQWYQETPRYSEEYSPIEGENSASITFIAKRDAHLQCVVTDDLGNSSSVDFWVNISRDAEEQDFAGAAAIKSGDTAEVNVDAENFAKYFKFVPEKTAAYTFYSSSDHAEDMYSSTAELYDGAFNSLRISSDYGDSVYFRYSFIGQKGETYYIRTHCANYEISLSYSLTLIESAFSAYAVTDYYTERDAEGKASFEVTAWSSSSLHYQWSFITENDWDEKEPSVIENANDSSYTPAVLMTGYYICKVWDENGNSETITFNLTVDNALDASFNDHEIECAEGEKVLLNANVTADHKEGLQYSWRQYDYRTKTWSDLKDADGTSYTTPPVSQKSLYEFIAEDKYGNNASCMVTVFVQNHLSVSCVWHEGDQYEDKDSIIYHVTFNADDPDPMILEVSAAADKADMISYEWILDTDTDEKLTDNTSSKLVVPYTGYYYCRVKDKYDNSEYVYYKVNIVNDLKITDTKEKTIEVAEGETTVLNVSAFARNPESILYEWGKADYSEGVPIFNYIGETSDSSWTTPAVTQDCEYICRIKDTYKNYCDDEVHFMIKKVDRIDLKDAKITVSADGTTYNGTALTPGVTVEYDGKKLVEGSDYEITYADNINAGTDAATATITGIGNYKGTVGKTFSITKAAQTLEADDLSVVFSQKKAISVTGAQGQVTYTSGDVSVASVDAEGNVSGNAPGSAKITVFAAGNDNYLPAEKEITVTVQAAVITADDVTVSAGSFTYNGSAKKPAVTVKYGSSTLTEGIDYTVTYKDNINAGTDKAKVIVTGQGSYEGTVENSFSIAKAAQKLTVNALKVAVGKSAKLSVSGAKGATSFKSANAAIATVSSKGAVTGKKVGSVKITVTSKAVTNYKAASKVVTVKVLPAATAKVSTANLATGIKVTWSKVAGANGYILYRNNTKIAALSGNAKVAYTDKKANTNGTKYTYKVVAKASTGTSTLSRSVSVYRVARPAVKSLTNSASKKMTVKWGKNAKAGGYQIQYSTDKAFKSGVKTVKIAKAAAVSRVISGLKKNKTYYVRIRAYKGASYSVWSAVKSVKIKK